MIISVKKIWYGDGTYQQAKITLRSYWVDKAIRNNEDIKVTFKARSMTLTSHILKKPVGRRFFHSKIGSDNYELLDYFWRPNDELSTPEAKVIHNSSNQLSLKTDLYTKLSHA